MAASPRALVFSLCYGLVYIVCFYFNWTLFRFYPAYTQFSLSPLGPEAGPAINWYGWMAYALIASVAVTVVVPRSLAAKLSPTIVWGISAAVLAGIMIYERTWFF